MFCISCGKNLESEWKFCPFCGCDMSGINVSKKDNFDLQQNKDNSIFDFSIYDDFEPEIEPEIKKNEQTVKSHNSTGTFPFGSINGDFGNSTPVPNKTNFGKLYRVVYDRQCHVREDGQMDVCLERNNERESVYDNLMDYVFADISIAKRTDNYYADPVVVWDLKHLRCYAFSDDGIYYVKDNGIYFLDNSGKVTPMGKCDNIISIKIDGNMLKARIYKDMKQIAWNEHRDECGYMYEAYYDVYRLNTEIKTFYI